MGKNNQIDVAVVIGSKSDEEFIKACTDALEELNISYEVNVISAHRNPEKLREYISDCEKKGIKIIIAGAGLSAHLPGVIASLTKIPVIGVPIPAGVLKGVDALLSIVQMPGGVPVAAVGIGSNGAKNSAYLAKRILDLIKS